MKKTCKSCGKEKSIDVFHKTCSRYKGKKYTYLYFCNDCSSSKTRSWIEKNKERYLFLQRVGQKKYAKKHPERIQAQQAVSNATQYGKLAHLACEKCGNFLSEAHHFDYSKPLEVWWLCKKHHMLADKGKLVLYAEKD